MPKFTVDQMRKIMDVKQNIRNATVIAHVDHGKSTLTDALVRFAGISTKERYTDGRPDEQEKGITIKSTGLSLYFELPEAFSSPSAAEQEERGYLLNLIDSPGHVDFSSEVTAALRVTDGALVVVDCVEGVCVQTETVLRQALAERVKPVLVVNKIDRAVLELQLSHEELYNNILRVIESVNVIIATYQDESIGDFQVAPEKGTVAFASGLHGWGFTIPTFAQKLAAKLKKDPAKMQKFLWGDYYYDPSATKWTTKPTSSDGKPLVRGFCQFVLRPIYDLINACMKDDRDKLQNMLKQIEVEVKPAEWALTGKPLMKCIMPKFLPLAEALLQMMVVHLPSPEKAQQYRFMNLYDGPLDDECAIAIRDCNAEGPLMVYVSKMVPVGHGHFYAFGRVFSGTASNGLKVRIMGPNYTPGKKDDLFETTTKGVTISMGRYFEKVEDVPCGNIVCLVGIDQYLVKSGTVTTSPVAHKIRTMKFSVSPVVRIAVKPKKPSEITKVVEGLKNLAKIDTSVLVQIDEGTGEMIVAGVGELHLEIVLGDLEQLAGVEIEKSQPVVSFRETVSAPSSQTCLAKSPNKHNRLWLTAEPLPEKLSTAIESGTIRVNDDSKSRAQLLVNEYEWTSVNDARKIWAFGPGDDGANLLVDTTHGVQYLNEIKDSVTTAFQWTTGEGVLCGEPLRGVRWNLVDVTLHSDSIHRGGGQIIPTARRALYAAQMTAQPRLMEPVYLVEIQVDEAHMGGVYSVLSRRRGHVFATEQAVGTPLYVLRAYMPVVESFGFSGDLRGATAGCAFPQCVFDHWQVMPGDPLEKGNMAYDLLMKTRERKKMKMELPDLSDYLDKL